MSEKPLIIPLNVRALGHCDYVSVWRAMQEFTAARTAAAPGILNPSLRSPTALAHPCAAETADELWLVEHPAVYTQGMNGKPEHLLDVGDVPLVQTDRGGQVTYHGPGQIVVYVLIDLRRRAQGKGGGVRQLVTLMEHAVIDLLTQYNIAAHTRRDAPGVYVHGKKIAALGLRVRHGCSYHGLSLNVAMNLAPFQRINPCGYAGLEVTQVCDEGGPDNLADVSAALLSCLKQYLNRF